MTPHLTACGVVCPGGFGAEALTREWPVTMTHDAAGLHKYATCLVDRQAPELKRWEQEPRMRRASPITYYMLEAAHQALEAAPWTDRRRTGIVATFFLGCLVYTIRFYRQITAEGRRFASPVLFPETVFNSPVSHVVSVLGLGGPVYSQVGDKSCWANALRTAECWLARGSADQVLVLGAEEFEAHQLDAFKVAGLLRSKACLVGEGAGAILLARNGCSEGASLANVADGYSFGSRENAVLAASECLAQFPLTCPVLSTATGWMRRIATKASSGREVLGRPCATECEAATATCAWDTIVGTRLLGNRPEIVIPYWGLSQQCAAARWIDAPGQTYVAGWARELVTTPEAEGSTLER
jgi:Beta-ketoacyl synthase, N-terminal domain